MPEIQTKNIIEKDIAKVIGNINKQENKDNDKAKENKFMVAMSQTATDFSNIIIKGNIQKEIETPTLALTPFGLKENKYVIGPFTTDKLVDFLADKMYRKGIFWKGKLDFNKYIAINKETIIDMQHNGIFAGNKNYSSTKQKVIATIKALDQYKGKIKSKDISDIIKVPHLFVLGINEKNGDIVVAVSKDSEEFWNKYFEIYLCLPEQARLLQGKDHKFIKLIYRLINLKDNYITNKEIIEAFNIDITKLGKNPERQLKEPIDNAINNFNKMHKNLTYCPFKNTQWQNIKIIKGYKMTDKIDTFIKAKNKIEYTITKDTTKENMIKNNKAEPIFFGGKM